MKTKNRLQTNGAESGRVHFTIDPATGQTMLRQGNSVVTLDASGKPLVASGAGASSEGGAVSHETKAALSRAETWLAEIEQEHATGAPIEKHSFGGRDWFIRRGAAEHITLAGLWSARDGSGQLNLLQSGTFTRFQAALLFVYIVSGENDLTPYFEDFPTAHKQSASLNPKVIDANTRLFAQIIALNPGVLPRDDESRGSGSEVPDPNPLVPTRASSTRSVIAPAPGSKKTASTAKRSR